MILSGILVILVVAGALFALGLASLVARNHLIKMVMGLEFLGKAVTLVFILGGYITGDTGFSQAVVFILIPIEAVIAGVALALVILVKKVWKTFDISTIGRQTPGDEG